MFDTSKILARFKKGWQAVLDVPTDWYPFLIDLDGKLSKVYPSYQIVQVKEKFGSLRYSTAEVPVEVADKFAEIIRETEFMIAAYEKEAKAISKGR